MVSRANKQELIINQYKWMYWKPLNVLLTQTDMLLCTDLLWLRTNHKCSLHFQIFWCNWTMLIFDNSNFPPADSIYKACSPLQQFNWFFHQVNIFKNKALGDYIAYST